MTVLQKLLSPALTGRIIEQGYDQVGGVVVEAAQAATLNTPQAMLGAYGFHGSPEFVDVVRFEVPVAAVLTRPDARPQPWPTYPSGFLVGSEIVPVWELSRTRYSPGAEFWRIGSDGGQQRLSSYAGAARGWIGARGWRPPARLTGPRARWNGGDFPADRTGDVVLLTDLAEAGRDGWQLVRPGVWTLTVPTAACELYEPVITAFARGIPVRLLDTGSGAADVLLTAPDPESVALLGAGEVEPGAFEARLPVTELTGLDQVERSPAS